MFPSVFNRIFKFNYSYVLCAMENSGLSITKNLNQYSKKEIVESFNNLFGNNNVIEMKCFLYDVHNQTKNIAIYFKTKELIFFELYAKTFYNQNSLKDSLNAKLKKTRRVS